MQFQMHNPSNLGQRCSWCTKISWTWY
jgi:hypothetical protein